MHRIGMDIDTIGNMHPIYCIWYHSLWKEAIKALQLLEYYKDSSFYSLPHLEPTSNVPVQDTLSSITMEVRMQHFNSDIFDKIGGSAYQQGVRENLYDLKKIAVRSVQSIKYAICAN
jgi:hypothetical protein